MLKKKAQPALLLILFLSLVLAYPLFSQNSFKFGKRISQNEKSDKRTALKALFCFYPSVAQQEKEVKFYDLSVGEPDRWCWSFGDGQLSYERNPKHRYLSANVYFIALEVKRNEKTSQARSTILVRSATNSTMEELKADFIFEPENPQIGVPVRFYDISVGNATKWIWQFGYFDYSFLKQPVKTFFYEGDYKVTLTVGNESGSDKITRFIKVGSPPASVITASSCALADVQAAIATAKAGDTVVVPNGTASWSSPLIINKGIILKAATQGGVKIINDTSMSSNANSIDPSNYVIAYVPLDETTGQPFRLSGFVIDGGGKRWTFLGKTGSPTLMVNKFRLDHCTFQNGYGNAGLVFYGEIYGVIDNCTIYGGSREFAFNETTWRNFTFEYGSANNRYYEDNIFYFGTGMNGSEGGLGGRYCFRYNTFYNQGTYGVNPWFDMHGNMGTGGNLSTMGAEIYGNVIYCNNKSLKMLDQRGGKLIAFNNKGYNVNGANGQKIEEEYPDSLNPPETNPAGQPQHVSDSYYWNQYYNDSLNYDYYITPTVDYEGNTGIVPRWDVHCFKQVQKFDGSSGVGVGPLAQRPSYCTTEGVAWWATDENKLYRWHNGQWELFYTPYTYPHPLRTTLND